MQTASWGWGSEVGWRGPRAGDQAEIRTCLLSVQHGKQQVDVGPQVTSCLSLAADLKCWTHQGLGGGTPTELGGTRVTVDATMATEQERESDTHTWATAGTSAGLHDGPEHPDGWMPCSNHAPVFPRTSHGHTACRSAMPNVRESRASGHTICRKAGHRVLTNALPASHALSDVQPGMQRPPSIWCGPRGRRQRSVIRGLG